MSILKSPDELVAQMNKSLRQGRGSAFQELVPHISAEEPPDIKTADMTRAPEKLLRQFHTLISFQFPDRTPFSILPCILGLPEKLSDWPDPRVVSQSC